MGKKVSDYWLQTESWDLAKLRKYLSWDQIQKLHGVFILNANENEDRTGQSGLLGEWSIFNHFGLPQRNGRN